MRNLPCALAFLALSGGAVSCLGPVPRDSDAGDQGVGGGAPNGGAGAGAGGARAATGGSGGALGVDAASGVGSGGGAGTGAGGTGSGGSATDGGAGGAPFDAGVDLPKDVLVVDIRAETPVDVPIGADGGQTFTNVFAIISSGSDNAPGCTHCHDGDAAVATSLPHALNFTSKSVAYLQLTGVPSLVCAGQEGGPVLERVNPGSPDNSVLVQKLRAGLRLAAACGGAGMPANVFVTVDGGGPDGSSSTVQTTHYAITMAQLQTIIDWVNAGAPNN
jgi:hypothetical protein